MKPRIFIGSSRESIQIAEKIKELMSDDVECQLWTEFFEFNENYFTSLTEGAILYDFGIFVASADDIVNKRGEEKQAARDNIIFEFGLYLGKLGTKRSFFLKEKGLGLPSDLEGIKLPEFDSNDDDTLINTISSLKVHILKEKGRHRLSYIPSTILAVGYMDNFLEKVCKELVSEENKAKNNLNYESFKLHVVVPDELPVDADIKIEEYIKQKKLEQIEVPTSTRPYPFYIDKANVENKVLELYDFPTTVTGLRRASLLAFPSDNITENERADYLQRRELLNFCDAVRQLVNKNGYTKGNVVVDVVDI